MDIHCDWRTFRLETVIMKLSEKLANKRHCPVYTETEEIIEEKKRIFLDWYITVGVGPWHSDDDC